MAYGLGLLYLNKQLWPMAVEQTVSWVIMLWQQTDINSGINTIVINRVRHCFWYVRNRSIIIRAHKNKSTREWQQTNWQNIIKTKSESSYRSTSVLLIFYKTPKANKTFLKMNTVIAGKIPQMIYRSRPWLNNDWNRRRLGHGVSFTKLYVDYLCFKIGISKVTRTIWPLDASRARAVDIVLRSSSHTLRPHISLVRACLCTTAGIFRSFVARARVISLLSMQSRKNHFKTFSALLFTSPDVGPILWRFLKVAHVFALRITRVCTLCTPQTNTHTYTHLKYYLFLERFLAFFILAESEFYINAWTN